MKCGHDVVVIDNLTSGHSQAVDPHYFIEGDFGDTDTLRDILTRYDIQGVMHFAASTGEQQSSKDPFGYYRNNVINSL